MLSVLCDRHSKHQFATVCDATIFAFDLEHKPAQSPNEYRRVCEFAVTEMCAHNLIGPRSRAASMRDPFSHLALAEFIGIIALLILTYSEIM